MIQFVSPDDEHDMLETWRVINRNKYIEKNLCITLVIYQESFYDAWSTKCKMTCCIHSTSNCDNSPYSRVVVETYRSVLLYKWLQCYWYNSFVWYIVFDNNPCCKTAQGCVFNGIHNFMYSLSFEQL